GGLDDPVAEADVLRPLAGGGQEHLRRARVAVLLEEGVLDPPPQLEAGAGGLPFVRGRAAARNTSGALEWLYSSRKWCSTSHATSKPSRSASSTCSSASWVSWRSLSASPGGGSWCS